MYKIVLYNSGNRIKVLSKHKLYTDALCKYNKIVDNNQIFFSKKYMWDNSLADYELVIIGPKSGKNIEYVIDSKGKRLNIKSTGNFVIKQIKSFYLEEKINHKEKNKTTRLIFKEFVKFFLLKNIQDKTIFCVNNKLIIEYFEDQSLDLFILKNSEDSKRLIDLIKNFCSANKIENILYFKHPTKEIKKELLDNLEKNYGISRDYMNKVSTR